MKEYLNMIEDSATNSNAIEIEIDNLHIDLKKQLEYMLSETKKKILECDNVLTEVTAIEHIQSIIKEKAILQKEYTNINKNFESINIRFEELKNLISNIKKVE